MQVDLLALVTAISLLGNLALGYKALRPKEAEGEKSIVDAATSLIRPLQERIATLEKADADKTKCMHDLEATVRHQQATIDAQARTIKRQEARIDLLETQLRSHGFEPFDPNGGGH